MAKSYREVARFPSKSNPSKEYTVNVDENGNLSCTCPAWTFKKGDERTCRHVQEVAAGVASPVPAAAPAPQAGSRDKGGSLTDLFARLDKGA